MTRTHQLETTLRALRLSGMLETIEARLDPGQGGRPRPRRVPPGAV